MRGRARSFLRGRMLHIIALRRAAPEQPDPAAVSFFDRILRVTNEDVFHRGNWNLLEVNSVGEGTFENLLAWEWQLEQTWKMIVVNLSGGRAQGRIPLADRVSASASYMFYDELNEVRYPRAGQELQNPGLYVRLEAFRAHLFDVSRL